MNRPSTTLGAAVALAAVLAAASACTNADPDSDDPGAESAADAAANECDPELDEAFSAWAEAGFSGSIAISTGGEPECLIAYGLADQEAETPNTVDTVFSIGSISKAFTAAAVLDLAEAGRLSLDDRAGDLVPGLGGPAADATVEQLLVHTSGLIGSHGVDHEPLGHDEAVAAIGRLEQSFEPGSDFGYSNAGYTLLALVVEEVSGPGYRDYLAAEILPLPGGEVAGGFWDGEPAAPEPRAVGNFDEGATDQMGDFEGPHWALAGNGDLAMTTRQLAAWTHALFTGQIVSPAAAEVIGTPGFDQGDGTAETPGWVASDESMIGEPFLTTAGGGGDVGHNAVVAWLPESERVVAMASNTPDVAAEDLLQEVGPALAAGDPLPTPDGPGAPVGAIDPADLEAHTGTYELETGGSFDVTAGDGGLEISAGGADAVEALFPPTGGYTADDVSAHEQGVLSLLAGDTQEGRSWPSLRLRPAWRGGGPAGPCAPSTESAPWPRTSRHRTSGGASASIAVRRRSCRSPPASTPCSTGWSRRPRRSGGWSRRRATSCALRCRCWPRTPTCSSLTRTRPSRSTGRAWNGREPQRSGCRRRSTSCSWTPGGEPGRSTASWLT